MASGLRAGLGRRLLWDLALMAVLLGVAWGPRLTTATSYSAELQSEERLYNRYAVPWALGEGSEPREKYFPWHPLGSVTHRPPGYILFVGAIYRLAGVENFAAVRLAQAALDTTSVLLVYLAGLLLFGGLAGRVVGFGAALAMARYDFLYLHVARILSETLYVWLCLVVLVVALGAARKKSLALTFLAAYLLGWANLVRPFLLLAIPAFILWALILPGATRRWRFGLVATLGLLLAIAPVTWRNWQFHQAFIPISTNSGFTLYQSLADVEGLSAPEELVDKQVVEDLGLGELAQSDEFRRRALEYMQRHPEDLPKILARKVEVLLAAKGGHKVSHELMVTPVDEWLYPLVLLGALLSLVVRPRVAWHGRLLIWVLIASQVAVCLLANAEARYRVPLVPLLALLAMWVAWVIAVWVRGQLKPGADSQALPLAHG